MEDSDWVVVQRFYVIHPSGDVYEEKYKQQERWETRKKSSSHALMHSKYVYDRLCDGKTTKWSVMKDRVNGHSNQVLPSDEYLFMLILSARSVKDYVLSFESLEQCITLQFGKNIFYHNKG